MDEPDDDDSDGAVVAWLATSSLGIPKSSSRRSSSLMSAFASCAEARGRRTASGRSGCCRLGSVDGERSSGVGTFFSARALLSLPEGSTSSASLSLSLSLSSSEEQLSSASPPTGLPCQGQEPTLSANAGPRALPPYFEAGFHVRTDRPRAAIARLMGGWPNCGPAFQSRGPPGCVKVTQPHHRAACAGGEQLWFRVARVQKQRERRIRVACLGVRSRLGDLVPLTLLPEPKVG